MKWLKKGFICSHETLNLLWAGKNIMTPLPMLLPDGNIRLYLTICDKDNVGRVGYVDLDAGNPLKILKVSQTPVLDVGARGTFDEHGVLPTSLLAEEDGLYLYYSAYQKQVSVPYTILSGLAVSHNGGETFTRVSDAPILDRRNGELFQRSAIEIMKKDGRYLMWYTSNLGWINNGIHEAPEYDLKFLQSDRRDVWTGTPVQSIALKGDEYGLTMPQVFFENGIFKMFYSIRSISKGYRLGYAESIDGIVFERKDEEMGIDVSETGFDSEMICFGKILKTPTRTYLFYCGNHYGIGGLGYAELEETHG